MQFTIERYLGSNITTVYEHLDLTQVSRDTIKRSIPQSNLVDTEDLLIVISPSGILAQVAEERVVVSDQTSSIPGRIPLWSITPVVHRAMSNPHLTAYGFNYDVGVRLEEDPDALAHLTRLFVPGANGIEEKLNVRSLMFVPRLLYLKDEVRYDLRFDAARSKEDRMIVHLNAHHGTDVLPQEDDLRHLFVSEFEEITRVLGLL